MKRGNSLIVAQLLDVQAAQTYLLQAIGRLSLVSHHKSAAIQKRLLAIEKDLAKIVSTAHVTD